MGCFSRRSVRRWVVGAASTVLCAGCCETVLALPDGVTGYETIPLGILDGYNQSNVSALDEYARVVGSVGNPTPPLLGTIWINGVLYPLPALPGATRPSANYISSTSGLIGGGMLVGDRGQGALWKLGRGVVLLENYQGGWCSVQGVNDAGWASGSCGVVGTVPVAWVRAGSPFLLGHLGGGGAGGASDINELNEIIGRSQNADRVSRPFLWRDGVMIDIGRADPRDESGVARINNNSEVIGIDDLYRNWGYLWRDGERTYLPEAYPCDFPPRARGLNDRGIVVGLSASDGCGKVRATVFDMNKMEAWIVDEHLHGEWGDFVFYEVNDVNNAGQMAMSGEYPGERPQAYLTTPYRFNLSRPAPGRAGEVNTIRVTNLDPGQQVHLVWGSGPGALRIRDDCDGATVLIHDAKTVRTPVIADADGVAVFTLRVNPDAAGRTFRLQAIAADECQISHTVTWTFE